MRLVSRRCHGTRTTAKSPGWLALALASTWALGAALVSLPRSAGASRHEKDRGRGARGSSHAARALPAIELHHLSTNERFTLRPDPSGRFGSKRLKGFRHFLRCHHTGREHSMAPRLAELLWTTAHHYGDRSITIIAGYRAPKVAREKGNPRSPHKQGVACDFRVAGIGVGELRDYVRRTFHGVGVGYYPNSGFVHLDVGRRRDAFWIDYSGPGERARYSRDKNSEVQSGTSEERDEAASAVGGSADPAGEAAAAGPIEIDDAPSTAAADGFPAPVAAASRKAHSTPEATTSPLPNSPPGAPLPAADPDDPARTR